MWLRHFAARRRTKRYKEYRERYWQFRSTDIVHLCKDCHKEIHKFYYAYLWKRQSRPGTKPCRQWTWTEAEQLMKEFRAICTVFVRERGFTMKHLTRLEKELQRAG